jgi:thiosulfate dehydrogenase
MRSGTSNSRGRTSSKELASVLRFRSSLTGVQRAVANFGIGKLFGSRNSPHLISLLVSVAAILAPATPGIGQEAAAPSASIWTVPEVGALPDDAHGRLVRRGRDLIAATYAHIGPEVPDPADRYAGNNLACGNCHLQAGTKKFGLALFGLFGDYPRYSVRSGAQVTIEGRVNNCMTRSMNGRAMPLQASQMTAITAYIKFLSTGVPAGEQLAGLGAGKMPELARAASPPRGLPIFTRNCAGCHGADGAGVRRSLPTVDLGYIMPPLWGSDSFNDGAGMARLTTAANFVHFNMPHGADYLNPQLSVEEAWDVAAYLVSQPRPHKQGLDRDYPDLLEKPVDTPYGPYADGFSEEQHKYGPFAPIREALTRQRSGK